MVPAAAQPDDGGRRGGEGQRGGPGRPGGPVVPREQAHEVRHDRVVADKGKDLHLRGSLPGDLDHVAGVGMVQPLVVPHHRRVPLRPDQLVTDEVPGLPGPGCRRAVNQIRLQPLIPDPDSQCDGIPQAAGGQRPVEIRRSLGVGRLAVPQHQQRAHGDAHHLSMASTGTADDRSPGHRDGRGISQAADRVSPWFSRPFPPRPRRRRGWPCPAPYRRWPTAARGRRLRRPRPPRADPPRPRWASAAWRSRRQPR